MSQAGSVEAKLQDHAPLLERAFEIDLVEGDWTLKPEGEVPSWLSGTYYLNGPGHFPPADDHAPAYRHWLDADGAVSRLRFEGGPNNRSVHFTQRFVDSRKRQEEREAGHRLYRAFGTHFEGDRLKRGIGLESPVNVSAYLFGQRLLAFGEQGLPYALDPTTLKTQGEFNFDGRLNAISPLSAHPCFSLDGREMFNFGISFSARQPSLTLYRFRDNGELIYRRRHPLPYPCSTHDFVLSERFAIIYLSPHLLDVKAMMVDGLSVNEALDWRPELGARLLVFEREDGSKKADIRLGGGDEGSGYCLHLVNAFGEGGEQNGRLTIDLVELERPIYDQYQPLPDFFVDAPGGGPRRFVIDVEAGELISKRAADYERCPDFPAIDPRFAQRPYDDFWLLGLSHTGQPGRKFFDQLAHLAWSRPQSPQVWTAPKNCYLGGEPVFLGDADNGGDTSRGCVLCQIFDAEKRASAFLLFDAFDITSGPIARLPLENAMPLGFHAVYYPD